MTQDISHVLEGWDFRPQELNVRIIKGDDGADRIQMRIDLGLLQMHMDGRPDGERPHGGEGLLEYYERECAEYGNGYRLGHDAIDDLFREGWQFYQRYLCLFHLAQYELVIRDTDRILRLFHFIRCHAKRRRDQWRFDQYRPYVLMMNTRAKAMIAVAAGDRNRAIGVIESGCQLIDEFLREYAREDQRNDYFELEFLRRWLEELRAQEKPIRVAKGDPPELRKLKNYLQRAIDREDYEHAAVLRDKIKRLGYQEHPPIE